MKYILEAALFFTLLTGSLPARPQQSATATSASTIGVLPAEETMRLMPSVVFFRGQSAPIQARNAAAVRFPSNALVLAALVDTSGYSSAVQERYQAYFITEQSLSIDGNTLLSGAYGVGFLPNDQFVVMDLGGHDLFLVHSTPDPAMRRPRPLQISPDPANPNTYRLYEGRSFVSITPARH